MLKALLNPTHTWYKQRLKCIERADNGTCLKYKYLDYKLKKNTVSKPKYTQLQLDI